MNNAPRDLDEITGTEIRSHEWDGIRELDTPLPRWWLWTFLATVIWAVGYWVAMPAWPLLSDYTKGLLGWSQRDNVAAELIDVAAARKPIEERLLAADLSAIETDQELLQFALASGAALFKDNCAPCHGSGAQGARGYPNLNDDDWLWGGTVGAIHQTITHGIRNSDLNSRFSEMPAFLTTGALTRAQISDMAEYVLSLSGAPHDAAAAARAKPLYDEQCVSCHLDTGKGDRAQGAANLADGIWLYGGGRAELMTTIATARNSSMPAWGARLSPASVRALAIYVHSLGGGEIEQLPASGR